MRYKTELMKSILTNKKAKEIIDYVSPIYGEAYVGLWIFQAIGTVLDDICDKAEALRYETVPGSSDLLLSLWEDHYGLPRDSSLTKEQRQKRLTAYIAAGGPCNPHVLSDAVSAALNGVDVDITENISKNTFQVNLRSPVKDYTPAVTELDLRKPAHLIYGIRSHMDVPATSKIAVAATHTERYAVDVLQVFTFQHEVPADMITAVAATHAENFVVKVSNPTEVPTGMTVESDGEGNVRIIAPECAVTYESETGTVKISGLSAVSCEDGNVTIVG